MSDVNEAAESTTTMARSEGSARWSSEKGLAMLLLRLLGVYFAAGAISSGIGAFGRVLFVATKFGWGELATLEVAILLAGIAPELISGIYFLIGGQWILDKVSTPLYRKQAVPTT